MEMKWSEDGDENEMDELKWQMRWSEDGKKERLSSALDFHSTFSV